MNPYQWVKLLSQIQEYIAKSVKQIRNDQGMSITELSAKSGLTKQYLYQIEDGSANLSINKLEQIADALNMHVSKLLLNYNNNNQNDDLSSRLKSLSEERKSLIMELVSQCLEVVEIRDLVLINELVKIMIVNKPQH